MEPRSESCSSLRPWLRGSSFLERSSLRLACAKTTSLCHSLVHLGTWISTLGAASGESQAACFQIPAWRLPSHLSDLCSTVTSSKEGFCAPLPVSVSTLPPSPPSHFARTFFQKLSIFTYLYFYVLTLTLPQQNVSSLEAHTLSVLFHLFSH